MAVGLCFRDDAGQFLHAPIVWSPCKVIVLEAEAILVSQSLKFAYTMSMTFSNVSGQWWRLSIF